jgi:hypothetical protein
MYLGVVRIGVYTVISIELLVTYQRRIVEDEPRYT